VAWRRKAFFSEEKKQKTFEFSGVCAAWTANRRIKVKPLAATMTGRHLG
jgi:hypothetical protein